MAYLEERWKDGEMSGEVENMYKKRNEKVAEEIDPREEWKMGKVAPGPFWTSNGRNCPKEAGNYSSAFHSVSNGPFFLQISLNSHWTWPLDDDDKQ